MLGLFSLAEHSVFCMTRFWVNLRVFPFSHSSQVFPHPATVASSPGNFSVSMFPLGSCTGWIASENVIFDGKMIKAMSKSNVVLLKRWWILKLGGWTITFFAALKFSSTRFVPRSTIVEVLLYKQCPAGEETDLDRIEWFDWLTSQDGIWAYDTSTADRKAGIVH